MKSQEEYPLSAEPAIKSLAMSLREATGLERTPFQVMTVLQARGVKNVKRAALQILDDHDLVMVFSREIKSTD